MLVNNYVKKNTQHCGHGVHKTETDYRRQSKHPKEYLEDLIELEEERYEQDLEFHFYRSEN